MTTQPTNHRAEADIQLSVARDDPQSDPIGLGILHGILALHDLLVEIRDEDGLEPRHRLELDEDDPDTLAGDDDSCPHDARRENPDGSATCSWCDAWSRYGWRDTDDTVPHPRFHGLAYIDDNAAGYEPREEPTDRVRLSGFAAIHRHDDFGPPWGAA